MAVNSAEISSVKGDYPTDFKTSNKATIGLLVASATHGGTKSQSLERRNLSGVLFINRLSQVILSEFEQWQNCWQRKDTEHQCLWWSRQVKNGRLRLHK